MGTITRDVRDIVLGGIALIAALAASGVTSQSAAAQDLIDLYQAERMHQRIRMARKQPKALPRRGPKRVTPPADSLRRWIRRQAGWTPPRTVPPLDIQEWQAVPHLAHGWFEKKYGQTDWAFSGTGRLTPLDTLFTPELRARLQARFGAPTRTLGDYSPHAFEQASAPAQFEYWIVANDTIPLKVMDMSGPFGRGLVVASDQRFQHRLNALRAALENELMDAYPDIYVDYYYLDANDTWFRTGYDGNRYLLEAIDPPNLHLGRAWMKRKEAADDPP